MFPWEVAQPAAKSVGGTGSEVVPSAVPSASGDVADVGVVSGGLDPSGDSPSGAGGTGDCLEGGEGLEFGLALVVPAGKTVGNVEI